MLNKRNIFISGIFLLLIILVSVSAGAFTILEWHMPYVELVGKGANVDEELRERVASGTIWVGDTVTLMPWGEYGYIEKEMGWNADGSLRAAYIEHEYDAPLRSPFTLTINKRERLVEDWGPWEPYKYYQVPQDIGFDSVSRYTFKEQGEYQAFAELPSGASPFRLGTRSTPIIRVLDPKYNRMGKTVISSIDIKSPKIMYDSSDINRLTECNKMYVFQAFVEKERIVSEIPYHRESYTTGKPQLFKKTVWTLYRLADDKSRTFIREHSGESFGVLPKTYGDGEYILEAKIPDSDQGKGIQNFRVSADVRFFRIRDCGQGSYIPKAPQKGKTETEPEDTEVSSSESLKAPQLQQNNLVPGKVILNPEDFIKKPGEKPGKVPVKNGNCPFLEQQIIHRRNQLQIPCSSPLNIMTSLINAPKEYYNTSQEMINIYSEELTEIKKRQDKLKSIVDRWNLFVKEAAEANAIIPPGVLAKIKRTGSYGGPAIIGDGLPLTAFEFDPKKIAKIAELEKTRREIGDAWAKERNMIKNNIDKYKNKIKEKNQQLESIHKSLGEMQIAHRKRKEDLSDMFYSGKYEHCLGFAGESRHEDIYGPDGNIIFNLDRGHLGLPGMNIDLPPVPELKLPEPKIPPAPPLIRLKMNGIEHTKRARDLIESLYEAKRLENYAQGGTFWLWLGNKLDIVNKTLGTDILYKNIFLTNEEGISGVLTGLDKSADDYIERYKKVGKFTMKSLSGLKYFLTEMPLDQAMEAMNESPYAVLEGTADDVVNLYKGWQAYEDFKPADEMFAEFADSPQENNQAIFSALDKMKKLDDYQKAWESGETLALDAIMSLTGAYLGKTGKATDSLQEFRSALRMKNFQRFKDAGDSICKSTKLKTWLNFLEEGKKKGLYGTGEKVDDILDKAKDLDKTRDKIDDAAGNIKNAQKTLDRLEDDAADLANKPLVTPPKEPLAPIEPKKVIDLGDGKKLNLGDEMGKGQLGDVFIDADNPDQVVKVFNPKEGFLGNKDPLDTAKAALEREKKGAKILEDLGLEHKKILADGKLTNDMPYLKKELLSEKNGEFIGDSLLKKQGNKLSDGQQKAVMQYVNDLNQKGYVAGDFKPDNVYFKKLHGEDRWQLGVLDTDFIDKPLHPEHGCQQIQFWQMHDKGMFGEAARAEVGGGSHGTWADLLDKDWQKAMESGKLDDLLKGDVKNAIKNNPAAFMNEKDVKTYNKALSKIEESQDEILDYSRKYNQKTDNLFDELYNVGSEDGFTRFRSG